MTDPSAHVDGLILDTERLADRAAIQDLAIAYGHAVDDRDWVRFEALFLPGGFVDYRSSGGICGTPAEVAAWMPDGLALFTWCMHSISTHEITLIDDEHATGRAHVFNRNGLVWEGEEEILDVGAVYHDDYLRQGERWVIARRIEATVYTVGGRFAEVVRSIMQPVDLDAGRA